MKKCSEMIRALREDKDLKQSEIAKVINTSQQQYSKYETGYAEIPLKAILELADFYGVSTDYLLGRVDYCATAQDIDAFLRENLSAATMLSTLQSLCVENQKAVFEYVDLLRLKETTSRKDT